jgi:tetratricopeptide (TPR) repeat protein
MKPDDPGRKMVYWQLGEVFAHQRRFEEAIEQCDLTLHDDPKHYVALNLRMDCLLGLAEQLKEREPGKVPGVYMEMGATADRLLAVSASPQAFVAAGLAYERAGRLDLAQERLKEAVRLEPRDVNARLMLGEVMWRAGDHEGALKELEQAESVDPGVRAQRDAIVAAWEKAMNGGAATGPDTRAH